MFVTPAPRVLYRLQRRCGRNKDNGYLGKMGACNRHITRIIYDAVFLFIGLVVFFIDNDQPEIGIRQKKRGARANNNPHLALRHAAPDAPAMCGR